MSASPPRDRHGTRVLSGVSAAFFWNVSHRALLYTVLPEIVAEGGGVSAGAVVFAIAIAYSLRMGLSGLERSTSVHSVRRTVLTSTIVFAAVPLVPAGPGRLAVFALLGLCGGSHFVRAGELLSTRSSRGRGFALQEASALVGLLVASLFVGGLIEVLSWRMLVWLWAGVGVLIWLVTLAMPDRRVREEPELPLRHWRPTPQALAFTAVNGAIAANTIGFASVIPTLLVSRWGLSTSTAGLWLGGVRIFVVVGLLTSAVIAQRVLVRRPTVLALLAFVAVTTPLLSLLPASPALLVALAAEMLLMHHLMPAGWGYASLEVAQGDRRRTFALMGLLGSLLGSAVLAPLVLFIAEAVATLPALALISVVNLVALVGLIAVGPGGERIGRPKGPDAVARAEGRRAWRNRGQDAGSR